MTSLAQECDLDLPGPQTLLDSGPDSYPFCLPTDDFQEGTDNIISSANLNINYKGTITPDGTPPTTVFINKARTWYLPHHWQQAHAGGGVTPINHKITATIDASGLSGSANGNLYLVTAPGKCDRYNFHDPGNTPHGDLGAYCDAHGNKDTYPACPEIDIAEFNAYGFRSTLHSCEFKQDSNPWFTNCDTNGKAVGYTPGWNDFVHLKPKNDTGKCMYGPNCYIDTYKPFEAEVSFPNDGEASMCLQLSQEENRAEGCVMYSDEYKKANMLDNMMRANNWTLVSSEWESQDPKDMSWLSGNCNSKPALNKDETGFRIGPITYQSMP